MYRYSVDDAITYTSEDLVLFRESPFACWMERLTLENPDHGIPPDLGSSPPGNRMERQDELAETLRTEGKRVALVDWDAPEQERRRHTLDAMRRGQDFIVNGQLALGPLSGSANLLMRTSGYSELGNYLYLPCDTQAKTTMHSAFRLCFLADLLHSLQGQLPGQMLVIRGGSDLLPLTTEDHIYHYRAVKQRFMGAMRDFRKHRMPDPAESSHFGRWSECANEVMRQRALRDGQSETRHPEEQSVEEGQLPELIAAVAAGERVSAEAEVVPQNPLQARLATSRGLQVTDTLVSQARALHGEPATAPRAAEPRVRAPSQGRALDTALENLSFIGSHAPVAASARRRAEREPDAAVEPESGEAPAAAAAPAPPAVDSEVFPTATSEAAIEATGIDRDEVIPEPRALHPAEIAAREMEIDCIDDSDYRLPGPPPIFDEPAEKSPGFSNSLNTAGGETD